MLKTKTEQSSKIHKAMGEREIIKIIQNQLTRMPRMPIPFGDDVSGYDLGHHELAILKTDMLVGKTDVPPSMSLWQASRKAVIMNISDFAAKGVKPLAILVSLGLPRNLTRENIEEVGRGLNAGAQEYEAYIVGGDTGEASDLIISISVFGLAKEKNLMRRDEARPGDVVAVTGSFGKSSAGLRIMLNGLKARPEIHRVLVESVLMPYARLKEGLALSRLNAVNAAIDSSDGLAWSLHEIANASNVGFRISKIPIAHEAEGFAKENGLDPMELAFYGGEEYELVLAVKPRFLRKAQEAVGKTGGNLISIGRVTREKRVLLETNGKRCDIEKRGYEHFSQNV